MNRQQRRNQLRQSVKPDKVYNIKTGDVQKMKDDATREASEQAFVLMFGLPVMVLRDKWGFGKTRLLRFIEQVMELENDVLDGRLTIEDVHRALETEIGVTIYKEGGDGR